MRVYFIKDWKEFKTGQDATLWDASEALRSGAALPYEDRKLQRYESQAEETSEPQSAGEDPAGKGKTAKKVKTEK